MDAGFLSVVENEQYFMTKDAGYLTQFNTVACREYTFKRRINITTKRMDPKKHPNWTRAGSYNQLFACGVEIRIMSLSRDDIHSWVRISHGSNRFVMDLNQQRQKFPKISSKNMRYNWMRRILHADQRQKQKPQRRGPAGSSPRIVPTERRNWIDIEPGKHSLRVRGIE